MRKDCPPVLALFELIAALVSPRSKLPKPSSKSSKKISVLGESLGLELGELLGEALGLELG
jgi:hypothetical protein